MATGRSFWERVKYRVWQFWVVLFPRVDSELYREARAYLPRAWRRALDRLGDSEKAHVIRLFREISHRPDLAEPDRAELLLLALTHDLGKGIQRPTVFYKVVKVLFSLPNSSHAILGARLLRRLGAPSRLVRRVRFHHDDPGPDRLLAIFQQLDDDL